MGDDFRYHYAHLNYESMDLLIEAVNRLYPDKYRLQYSTPSDYLKALQSEDITFRTREQDIFPMIRGPM